MKASEVMTRDVIAVSPDTSIADVAAILVDHRIGGVPVIDHDEVVGIVTENDLLRRVEVGTERTRPRWLQFLTSDDILLAEYVKSYGQTARDVMSRNVVAVQPDTPIKDIADTMESRHIKRVPVVENGKVVGIVSRANLIQALATLTPEPPRSAEADDVKIHDALCAELARIAWTPAPIMNNVIVSGGIVHLWGFVTSEDERNAMLIAARRIAGVKEIRDHRSELLPKPVSDG